MTRERAKELLPVIQAYADGQDVQVYEGDYWHDCDETRLAWAIHKHKELRIKPEPKYRMPLIWVRCKANDNDVSFFIEKFDNSNGGIYCDIGWCDMEKAFDELCFLDGSPFGVEE